MSNVEVKSIDSLIDDIYSLFYKEHTVNEENLKVFSQNIANTVKSRLEAIQQFDKPTLRVSKLGTPDRKLWYELNLSEDTKDLVTIDAATCIKFIYGDLIEELLLLLVKEAGHKVEGEQGEIEVEGVIGHRDCKIDGITTDIKSTSKFSFQKFQKGTLMQDDPFGYIAQISTYSFADESPFGAFLAMNKETGQLALLKVDKVDMIHPPSRIKHVRAMVEKSAPPDAKCYPPEPFGKSGNVALHRNCSYCSFKELCWADANGGKGLRKFKYSTGVKEFVTVLEEPKVEELVNEG